MKTTLLLTFLTFSKVFATSSSCESSTTTMYTTMPMPMTMTMTSESVPSPTSTSLAKSLGTGDLGVLNYALTLEHLENEFYRQGVANYSSDDFVNADYPDDTFLELSNVAKHEKVHVDTLIKVINASYPNMYVEPCVYDFGVVDITGFVAVARALERTGVSAYLGRVAEISNKDYLTAAGTIVTVEARHASFLNRISGYSGAPDAFDTPLSPVVIVSIASQFIVSCPFDLGVVPLEKLTATADANGTVVVDSKYNGMMCSFLYGANVEYMVINDSKCYLPQNASTDTYLFITKDMSKDFVAGPAIITSKKERSEALQSSSASLVFSVFAFIPIVVMSIVM